MYKLYRLLKWFCTFLVFVLGTGLLSDQINTYAKEGKFIVAPSTVQLLLSPVVFYPSLAVLAGLFVLTFIAWKSDKKFKQRSSFDLFKVTSELTPEDLGFTVFSKGKAAGPSERPYYEGYLSRTYQSNRQSDRKNEIPTTEPRVLECIKRGDSVLLIGHPTEGKTRTAYELLRGLNGFTAISVRPDRTVPPDAFSILKGKQVVIFIDDLSNYISPPADLDRIYAETKKVAKQCVILATCRSGPELKQIALPTSNLNRFYENFTYELSLVPITEDQKQEVANGSGLSLQPERMRNAPTPGWVVMDNARITMEGRLKNLTPETKDTLHALKLLRCAGVGPPTRQRVENVLKAIFLHQDIHLHKALAELAENAFIKLPATQEPIQPEEAYLRDVVSYVDGKHPKEDIDALGQMLRNTGDAEGLHYLAITLAMIPKEYTKALRYLKRAVRIKENFHQAWYSMGVVFYEGGNECIRLQRTALASLSYEKAAGAYKKALKINPNYYQAWNNLGIIYKSFEEYEKAIEAYDEALKIKSNPEPYSSWYNKGSARCMMNLPDQYEKAISDFKKATEIKPDYAQAWSNMSTTLNILERYPEALNAAQIAQKLNSQNIRNCAMLGIILSNLNREDAIIWLCKVWRDRGELNEGEVYEIRQAFARLNRHPNTCENAT